MIWNVYKFFIALLFFFSPSAGATAPARATEMKVIKVISSDAALRTLGGPGLVKISFQEFFNRNRVALLLNGSKAFAGTLTTHPVSGLAHSIIQRVNAPKLDVYLDIDGKQFRATVWMKNGPYLAVERKNGSVRILQSPAPFAYERQD